MNTWAHRLKQSSTRQRAVKTELLPLPKPIRDRMSLEYHLQLEALRAGVGSLMALQMLMRVAVAAGLLAELGYGKSAVVLRADYEETANQSYAAGQEGSFCFDNKAFLLFAELVTNHDAQLDVAPLRAIDSVAKRLEQHCKAA